MVNDMLYNYKSNEIVQDVVLECMCPLIEDIIDEYSTLHRYESLSVYATSDIVKEIVIRLLEETDEMWVHNDFDVNFDKENEVVLTIGYDGMLFVESARNKGVLKKSESCLLYAYDGFNKRDIDELSIDSDSILIFGFEEDEIDDEDKDEITIESDGDMHGFSVSLSDENSCSNYSFYSTNKTLVEEMAKFF